MPVARSVGLGIAIALAGVATAVAASAAPWGATPHPSRMEHLRNLRPEHVNDLSDDEVLWLMGPGGFGLPSYVGGKPSGAPDADDPVQMTGRATHYAFPSGGNSCKLNPKTDCHCVAPSDVSPMWKTVMGIKTECGYKKMANSNSSATGGAAASHTYHGHRDSHGKWHPAAPGRNHSHARGLSPDGACGGCGDRTPPGCPYKQLCQAGQINNGGQMCIQCTGSNCKTNKWIEVKIADACPHDHPCNTCKGSENPCVASQGNHLDLCDPTYHYLATKQGSWEGFSIKASFDLSLCGEPTDPAWTDGCKGL